MSSVIPLLVAFLGAGFGAYFAFVKSRRERLWLDRYEALRDVVMSLETIQTRFETAHLEMFASAAISSKESERLEAEWPTARHELRRNCAKLRLLFKDEQVSKLIEYQAALDTAFFDLYNEMGPESAEAVEAIGKRAGEAINEAIRVAQKYCL